MIFFFVLKFLCLFLFFCQFRGCYVILVVVLIMFMYFSLYVEFRSNGGSYGSQFDFRICMIMFWNFNFFIWLQIFGVVCYFVWFFGVLCYEVVGLLCDIVVGYKFVSVSLFLCGGCLSVVVSISQRKCYVIKFVVFFFFVWGEFMCVIK